MSIKLTTEEKLRLQQVKDKIDNEYSTADFTVQELCKQFKFSDHKLRYGFEQLFGLSVSDYQTKKRLEHITKLLENEEMTISQAAYDAGYKEYSTFYRSFKREFKVTPHRWRKDRLPVTALLISCYLFWSYVMPIL